MKNLSKHKIKKFLKEKWYIAGGTVILFTAAIVAMFIGFHMTGWSLVKWLQSPYATTFFVFLIVGALSLFAVYVTFKRFYLGDDNYDETDK